MRLLIAVVLAGFPVCAAAKSPAPEFLVESNFQEAMARALASGCAELEFNHAAQRRHQMATTARLSDMGIHQRNVPGHFAPVPADRTDRHFQRFLARHGLQPNSAKTAFCRAARDEHLRRSAIGLMLAPAAGGTQAAPDR